MKTLTKNNSVILEVTADKYELPVAVYLDIHEMAESLNISINAAHLKIFNKHKSKNNTRFIRVYIGNEKEEEKE